MFSLIKNESWDVDSCEKPRGAANRRGSVDLRIGQPTGFIPSDLLLNS